MAKDEASEKECQHTIHAQELEKMVLKAAKMRTQFKLLGHTGEEIALGNAIHNLAHARAAILARHNFTKLLQDDT